ncbi:MAG: ABC transporter permease, partial [Deferribacterales bacterium]
GENTITVASGRIARVGKVGGFEIAKTMKVTDAEMVKRNVIGVKDVSSFVKRNGSVRYEMNNITTNILGVQQNYFRLKNFNIVEGRFLNGEDDENVEKVCVLGSEVKKKLFGSESAEGKYILIYRAPFKVVGVLEEKGSDLNGTNMDDMIYIPLNTFMRRAANLSSIDGFEVLIDNWDNFEYIKSGITKILRENHRLYGDAKDDFTIINPVDVLKIQNDTVRIVSFLGMVTAGISYLIGGLGIFSIMVLSVSLRRTEVGIRRAVGARRKDIFRQFLLESGIIGILGSFLGIIIGIIVSVIVFKVANLPFAFSFYGILFSSTLAIIVGIFAGIYPSFSASKTDPIFALRGE